jgi:arylsulfatase A
MLSREQDFRMTRTLLIVTVIVSIHASLLAAERPNIICVLCDDLGYGDLSCLNPQGKIRTPNFDRVAAEGMAFTDAHTGSAVCSPTRYGLMTGRYSWRSKLQQGVLGGLSPRLIEPGRLTVAELLHRQGYQTACFGKWHLGMDWAKHPGKEVTELNIEPREQVFNVDYGQPIANGPNSVGFDEYFGISASLDMVPYTFIHNTKVTVLPTEDRQFPLMLGRPGGMTREGPTSPGFKVEDVLPTLTERAVKYVHNRVKEGGPFFMYLPLASPHTPIAPTPEWQDKSGLNPYADFVLQTDHSLGQLLKAIDDAGIADKTLLVVTSDNGCSPQAKYEELLPKGHNPSYVFRGNKADIYEGGHRVPFLVRWPGKVKPGTRTDRLTCLTDFFATCAEVVGIPVPIDAAEDSASFLPTLLGEQRARDAIVHHSINGSFAVRDGEWKLALCPGSGGWSAPRPGRDDSSTLPAVQLFNLKADIGEAQNEQARYPEIVARLTAKLEQFVANGRSTPGPKQANAVTVDIYRGGREAQRPIAKKKAPQ